MDQRDRGLKISRGVYFRESKVSTPTGPVRLTLRLQRGVIDDLTLAGAGSPLGGAWASLARALKGVEVREADLLEHLRGVGSGNGLGETAHRLVEAILAAEGLVVKH